MASGQVTLTTQSVDYGGGRGHITLTNVIGWEVNDNSDISFWQISTSHTTNFWGLCYGSGPYYVHLKPQVSYDNGATWVTLADASHIVDSACGGHWSTYVNTITMSTTLINSLGSYHLTGDCQLRFLYYMDPTPAPSAADPNAFPNSSYSEVSQVPVHVEVSWTATVKYNANGGTGAPSDSTKTSSGDSTTITLSNTRPTRTSYRFEGWANSSTATTSDYQPGGTITIQKSSPTKTIYAVWTEYYRPGEHKVNGSWKSHNRSGGACERKVNGSWVELRTIDGGVGTTDPPSKKANGVWYNQRKVGSQ